MTYCINPNCDKDKRINPINLTKCQSCETALLLYEGRFRIVENITKSPHNPAWEVFIVEDIEYNDTRRVLKTLSKQADPYPNLFETERKILNECKHSGIPGFIQFFSIPSNQKVPKLECPELTCIVMELIDGQDLSKWVVNSRLNDPSQVSKWLEEIIHILGYLHNKNYFHRDIKPSNIMLKPNGDLVLIDFGGSRAVSSTVINQGGSTEVYSSFYSPPEQRIEGEFAAKPPSDFYALGQTFVHLSTGDTNTSDLAIWHRRTRFGVSPIIHLINWMRAEKISERPQNVDEILQVINYLKANSYASEIETKSFINKIKSDRNTGLIRFMNGFIKSFKNKMKLTRIDFFKLFIIGLLSVIAWGVVFRIPSNNSTSGSISKPIANINVDTLPQGTISKLPEDTIGTSPIANINVGTLPQDTKLKPLEYMIGTSEEKVRQEIDDKIQGRNIKLHRIKRDSDKCQGSLSAIQKLKEPNSKVDFVISSMPLEDDDKIQLQGIPIARDKIAVVVSQAFEKEIKKFPGLTVDDLKNIYTSVYKNWSQIRHDEHDIIKNTPIIAYSKDPDCSGTARVFKKQILEGNPLLESDSVKFVTMTGTALSLLNNNVPGSIYYLTLSEVESQPIIPIKGSGSSFVDPRTNDKYPSKLERLIYLVYRKSDEKMGNVIAKLLKSTEVQDVFAQKKFQRL